MPLLEIIDRITIREIEPLPTKAPADPFGIDDPCPMNGGGPHYDIVGCPEIVCIHCARIIWS